MKKALIITAALLALSACDSPTAVNECKDRLNLKPGTTEYNDCASRIDNSAAPALENKRSR